MKKDEKTRVLVEEYSEKSDPSAPFALFSVLILFAGLLFSITIFYSLAQSEGSDPMGFVPIFLGGSAFLISWAVSGILCIVSFAKAEPVGGVLTAAIVNVSPFILYLLFANSFLE